ncbi:hypothetical protein GCM10020367_08730 [Streptomyces sannanensis]|uniref:Transposase n=1 Tax=Streptomyces sannanensis TaxID=285536 RepID=A0ABP6S5Q6_9ACTN
MVKAVSCGAGQGQPLRRLGGTAPITYNGRFCCTVHWRRAPAHRRTDRRHFGLPASSATARSVRSGGLTDRTWTKSTCTSVRHVLVSLSNTERALPRQLDGPGAGLPRSRKQP